MNTPQGRREQLYVCVARFNDNPPPLDIPKEEVAKAHRAYLQDLHDRKILVGSGPARDMDGVNHAGAVFILRAPTLADAKKIAAEEPNVRHGLRFLEIIPWQRAWFED